MFLQEGKPCYSLAVPRARLKPSVSIDDEKAKDIKPEIRDIALQVTKRLGENLVLAKSGPHDAILNPDILRPKK